MGRRDPDERPPVEILGADLGVSSTQQVAVGPRRPKRGRAHTLVIAAAVVAVLVGGLALGGRDDDPQGTPREERDNRDRVGLDKPYTSTTDRRTTTTRATTTTTTLPLGPPLGTPVEGALLLIGPAWWRVVDLTDGSIRDISLPTVDPYASIAVAGGVVIPEGGEARYYPILGGGPDPEPQPLGSADMVRAAGSDRVWLIDLPPDGVGDGSVSVDVRLVDLRGQVLRSFEVPGRWVEGATADAVIVSRGGRVYAADENGVRAIAVGWSSGTHGGAAVVMTCDTDGSCALRRQPLDGGLAQTLVVVADPDAGSHTSTEAPDGRLAILVTDHYGGNAEVLLFAPDGRALGSAKVTADVSSSLPQWLPGGLGLVVGSGADTQWVRPDGDGWTVSPFRLGDQVSNEVLFVIPP